MAAKAQTQRKVNPGPRRGATKDPEAKLREALQLQLVGLRVRHHEIDAKISAHAEIGRELSAQRKKVRSAVEQAGMPLHIFDDAYNLAMTTAVDLIREEELREVCRSAFGLPIGARPRLNLETAEQVAERWEVSGFRCGISMTDPAEWPKPPPENIQDFERGLNAATARNAEGLKAADPLLKAGQPANDGRGDEDDDDTVTIEEVLEVTFTEATPEELAGQTDRRSLKEIRLAEAERAGTAASDLN